MDENELNEFKIEIVDAIKKETLTAMQNNGKIWVDEAVREIVPKAIEATFTKFGIDPSQPFLMQYDLAYLRNLRTTHEQDQSEIRRTLIGKVVNAVVFLLIGGLGTWYFYSSF